jgi:C1A family cysteine protease
VGIFLTLFFCLNVIVLNGKKNKLIFMNKEPTMSETKKLGWIPDIPDQRDFLFKGVLKPESIEVTLPTTVDLRTEDPTIYDQGQLGSCVGNAVAAAVEHNLKKQKLKSFTPSRLFIYYNAHALINLIKEDSGCYIRDAIKTINSQGVCKESTWKYIISKFKRKPTNFSYKSALQHTSILYQRINNSSLYDLKSCLANGLPIVFGMSVYGSFMSVGSDGIVPLPTQNEQLYGGHSMLIVGYDDNTQVFIVRNSWGDSWGNKGYCYIPYSYLTNNNLSDDFWVIQSIKTTN